MQGTSTSSGSSLQSLQLTDVKTPQLVPPKVLVTSPVERGDVGEVLPSGAFAGPAGPGPKPGSSSSPDDTSAGADDSENESEGKEVEAVEGGDQKRRKREDSTSLFTLVTENTYDVTNLQLLSTPGARSPAYTFDATLVHKFSAANVRISMDVRESGFAHIETEQIPLWLLTVTEKTPEAKSYSVAVTSNQILIRAMRILRPQDDANQHNQRLRRKWQTQRFFRFANNNAKTLYVRDLSVSRPRNFGFSWGGGTGLVSDSSDGGAFRGSAR